MNENTLQLIAKRRSCRKFTNEQISKEELSLLIQAAQGAPIGMNLADHLQLFVIQDEDILNELEQNTLSYFAKPSHQLHNHKVTQAIYQAKTLIIVAVAKLNGAMAKGMYCSAACMMENMILTATEHGLGSVYLTGVTTALNDNQKLLQKIGIPESFEAASALAIGYPAMNLIERDLMTERIHTKWIV